MCQLIFRLILAAVVTFYPSFTDAELRIDGGDPKWDANKWYAQVDGVMGGKSSGYLKFEESNSMMLFYGTINLDGGGFSSVRKQRFQRIDLTRFSGIVVTLEAHNFLENNSGDNSSPLGLHLQLRDNSRYGFSAAFAVPLSMAAGVETSVFLPLENFDRGDRNGFQCSNCALDARRISGVDLYVLFQEGDFRVRIKSITAVGKEAVSVSPKISFESVDEVRKLIEDTSYSSSFLYDYEYPELCISKYWSLLSTLLEATSIVSDDVKGVICAGLLHSTTLDEKGIIAWSLRYTIDAVLSDLDAENRTKTFSWLPKGEAALAFADKCVGKTSWSSDPLSFAASRNLTMPYDDLSPIPTGPMSKNAVKPPGRASFFIYRYGIPLLAFLGLLLCFTCGRERMKKGTDAIGEESEKTDTVREESVKNFDQK